MLRTATKLQLISKYGRFVSFRSFSAVVHKKFEVQQGGSLMIDFYKAKDAIVEISTAWQDHCDVEYEYDTGTWSGFDLKFHEDLKAQKLTLIATPPATCEDLMPSPIKCLKLTIPEMMNVSIIAHHLDLRVKNKVRCIFTQGKLIGCDYHSVVF